MDACPHVNRDDQRCNTRFQLDRIEQAFCVCFGAFHACPMFHQINAELAEEAAPRPAAVIRVTAYGSAVPLRATGT
jgi:hypothetical protein